MADLTIIGAGGHAKVAAAAWLAGGNTLIGFHDDDLRLAGSIRIGHPVLGNIESAIHGNAALHIAIGRNGVRLEIAAAVSDERCPVVVHPFGWQHETAHIGAGCLLCAGVIIQPDAKIGRHCIVNTGAIVEHDNTIGDFVHIAPGARLAGDVSVGDGAFVGLGACILPGVSVGENATVGAGAVVTKDVPANVTVAGNPARVIG